MSEETEIGRRELLAGALAATIIGCGCGCSSEQPHGEAAEAPTGPVDIGTAAQYPTDGAYDRFVKSDRILVVRKNGQLSALSSTCTHRKCNLRSTGTDLRCPCHGSRFDLDGHVIKGPASRDLPHYPVVAHEGGKLVVERSKAV